MSLTQPQTQKVGALQELEQILKKATEKKASDVHLKAGLPALVRINGALYYLGDDVADNIARLTHAQLTAWAVALMSPRQFERYEAGQEIDLGYEIPGSGRYRINLCQQRGNPRLVCRFIPDQVKTLEDLSLPPSVQQLLQAQRGLILVTGATGSGKSTTLAAMVDHITRSRSCHVITIEDPIEFVFKDRKSIVTQREVGLDTSSFTRALKYALRQDPDVILVGEMRDEETMLMALNAAETGHLVLSSLHTTDAQETLNRILGTVSAMAQGSVRAQLASVLIGVVSQRLLRRQDGKGRIAAVEILVNNQRVREMILDSTRSSEIRRAIEEGEAYGMQSFDQSLMTLVQANRISAEEALTHCSNVRDFQMRLEGVVPGEWREPEKSQKVEASTGVIEIEGLKRGRITRPEQSEEPPKKAGIFSRLKK